MHTPRLKNVDKMSKESIKDINITFQSIIQYTCSINRGIFHIISSGCGYIKFATMSKSKNRRTIKTQGLLDFWHIYHIYFVLFINNALKASVLLFIILKRNISDTFEEEIIIKTTR